MKKTIIIHDTFLYKGGGERLILLMAKVAKSDLASGFFSKGGFDLKQEGFTGKIISVSDEKYKKIIRHIVLKFSFLFKTKFLKNYDTVIFSGDCLSAVTNCRKDAKKYYYCHTPPRYIFDQKSEYLAKVPFVLKPFFLILVQIFKWMYLNDISKMDKIFTNSENTKKRLKKFSGYDSEIIYPPVDITFFRPSKVRKDYYFSFARLSSIKRVDKIVEAFAQMPDKNLKFSYGINDPQKDKILEFIKKYPNIEAIKSPDNEELKTLISESIATIYIPVDEDFGMSPVESMACGVPVIGVNDGGLKETIIDKETGILISSQAKIEEIIEAVEFLNLDKSKEMKEKCIKQANNFSLEKFENEVMEKLLN